MRRNNCFARNGICKDALTGYPRQNQFQDKEANAVGGEFYWAIQFWGKELQGGVFELGLGSA